MKIAMALTLAVALTVPALAFGHGGGEHVMGTVAAIQPNTLTVETTEKKRVEVSVDDGTKFEKSGAPAAMKDLTVGERVVVHTAKPAKLAKPGELKAVLVKFGPRAAGGHEHRSGQ